MALVPMVAVLLVLGGADGAQGSQTTLTSRIVTCEILSKGPGYEGPCRFTPQPGGSFVLTKDGGDLITETSIRSVRVQVTGKGRAQIFGLGVPGKGDAAVRDRSDPACWISNTANVTVCAR
jgi:hypothetical protein